MDEESKAIPEQVRATTHISYRQLYERTRWELAHVDLNLALVLKNALRWLEKRCFSVK